MALDFNAQSIKDYLKEFSKHTFILDNASQKGTVAIESAIDSAKEQIDKMIELYIHLRNCKSKQLIQVQKRIERLQSKIASDDKDIKFNIFVSTCKELQIQTPQDVQTIHSIINLLGSSEYTTLYQLKVSEMRLSAQIGTINKVLDYLENNKGDLDSYKSVVQSI